MDPVRHPTRYLLLLPLMLGLPVAVLASNKPAFSEVELRKLSQLKCNQYLSQAKTYYAMGDSLQDTGAPLSAQKAGSAYRLRGDIYMLLQRDCINNANVEILNKRVKALETEVARLKNASVSNPVPAPAVKSPVAKPPEAKTDTKKIRI